MALPLGCRGSPPLSDAAPQLRSSRHLDNLKGRFMWTQILSFSCFCSLVLFFFQKPGGVPSFPPQGSPAVTLMITTIPVRVDEASPSATLAFIHIPLIIFKIIYHDYPLFMCGETEAQQRLSHLLNSTWLTSGNTQQAVRA